MRVILSDAAEADLEDIGDFIAKDDPFASRKLIERVSEACAGLSDFPLRYPVECTVRRKEVRRRNVGRYAVFYRLEGEVIIIIRIAHSARDYTTLFDA